VSTGDEVAVASLIARIAQLADDGDLDDYVQCFTEDARWDMPGAARRGRADIMAGAIERRATGGTGPGSATRHSVSTIAVSVDRDTATASAYWQFWASTTTSPVLQLMGRYDDVFRRGPAGWQLDHRVITFG
jgi:3-phenylpropionate/cinnamic acid dioxygenase small subunit